MKVGVIGSGGREHAICLSLKNSSKIEKIFCFPGKQKISLILLEFFKLLQIACSLPPLPIIPTFI